MNDLVRVCISAYLNDSPKKLAATLACVYSLLYQTYDNYEIFIHHDGPLNDNTLAEKFRKLSKKITFIDNLEHRGHWGFFHRHRVSLMEPLPDWVVYTNEDNYYVPVFLERMLKAAKTNDSKMVICDMLHSHNNYTILNTYPAPNGIDMGAFMTHIDLIKDTPWTHYDAAADGKYAHELASKTTPVKADGILFVHN